MIKIVGGPSVQEILVFNVADDGSEEEINNIISIDIEPIAYGGIVRARIETFAKVDVKAELIE